MNTKLYVGNLAFSMEENQLQQLFEQSGTVVSVAMPTDRETGRKRGFAFVEMKSQNEAEIAKKVLDGKEVDGRQIVVNFAKPKERRW